VNPVKSEVMVTVSESVPSPPSILSVAPSVPRVEDVERTPVNASAPTVPGRLSAAVVNAVVITSGTGGTTGPGLSTPA